MKHLSQIICLPVFILMLAVSCKEKNKSRDEDTLSSFNLKRGEIISCGPQDGERFGTVSFTASIPPELQTDFNVGIALLHSFEYDEAEKMFAKVIDKSPESAMAYWGVAMANFHLLWMPPGPAEIKKGQDAIKLARAIKKKTKRESDYIEAIAKLYEDPEHFDHRTRVLNFEKAMEKIYLDYPDDIEAAVFYALALDAAADPADKTYANQRKAVGILNIIFQKEPLHPGIAHYIIHNCDYPELAELALPAARKYASIAPASAHAQHMPSHIFTRLGLWDESIQSNLVSVSSARCYAEKARLKGHWDEELHALDYLLYAYLQKGQDDAAKEQVDYLNTINEVSPVNFKEAYAFAAMPGRYFLEKRLWKDAAAMELHPADFPWEKFSWQESIFHFAKLLGAAHSGMIKEAENELTKLKELHEKLLKEKNIYKEAEQVDVQIKTSEAWLLLKQGKQTEALQLMTAAADLEDGLEKHPVTPGEIIPARELLGDMLMEMNKPAAALQAYEADLKRHQNRFNGLYGAGLAAERSGDKEKTALYFKKLVEIADVNCKRPELSTAKNFLK
jgi:tetratricopeptide (TPR) repeat protein